VQRKRTPKSCDLSKILSKIPKNSGTEIWTSFNNINEITRICY